MQNGANADVELSENLFDAYFGVVIASRPKVTSRTLSAAVQRPHVGVVFSVAHPVGLLDRSR